MKDKEIFILHREESGLALSLLIPHEILGNLDLDEFTAWLKLNLEHLGAAFEHSRQFPELAEVFQHMLNQSIAETILDYQAIIQRVLAGEDPQSIQRSFFEQDSKLSSLWDKVIISLNWNDQTE